MKIMTPLLSTVAIAAFVAGSAVAGTSADLDADANLSIDETSVEAVASAATDADTGVMYEPDEGTATASADGDMETDTPKSTLMADTEMAMEQNPLSGMTVDDVIGMWVYGETDEAVGEIDYVIEASGGYEAVIGVGGILGLGEYTVALPLERFEKTEDGDALRIATLTEAELRAMPEIDESGLNALDGDVVLN